MKLERESKISLSGSDFDRLLALSTARTCEDQLNVYYDDGGRLAGKHVTCRMRLSPGQPARMTLKVPGVWTGARRDAMELEAELPPGTLIPSKAIHAESTPPEIASYLQQLNVARLERIGWIRNRRWHAGLLGFNVELDRTSFPDGSVRFELEYEDDDESRHGELLEQVTRYAPSATPSTLTKFQRFLACLDPPFAARGSVER